MDIYLQEQMDTELVDQQLNEILEGGIEEL